MTTYPRIANAKASTYESTQPSRSIKINWFFLQEFWVLLKTNTQNNRRKTINMITMKMGNKDTVQFVTTKMVLI